MKMNDIHRRSASGELRIASAAAAAIRGFRIFRSNDSSLERISSILIQFMQSLSYFCILKSVIRLALSIQEISGFFVQSKILTFDWDESNSDVWSPYENKWSDEKCQLPWCHLLWKLASSGWFASQLDDSSVSTWTCRFKSVGWTVPLVASNPAERISREKEQPKMSGTTGIRKLGVRMDGHGLTPRSHAS